MFCLSESDSLHGRAAWYQGICCRCFRRYRFDPGAFIGGLLLGVIEIFGRAYISSQMADAIVFAVLIIVLLVKPTGLLGKKIQEKV